MQHTAPQSSKAAKIIPSLLPLNNSCEDHFQTLNGNMMVNGCIYSLFTLSFHAFHLPSKYRMITVYGEFIPEENTQLVRCHLLCCCKS